MSAFRSKYESRSILFLSTITSLTVLTGCPDPKGRLDQFEDRVIDAAPITMIDGMVLDEIPDIGGTWYVAYAPAPAPENPIHTIWDVTFTRNPDETATINVLSTPLNRNSRQKVGEAFPLPTININKAGEFVVLADNMPLPMVTNSLNLDILINVVIASRIRNKDSLCGIMTDGKVVDPEIPLTGSTMGGQRVAPGTEGNNLPAEILKCPPDEIPDAGVPDARPVDANAGADAAASDATTTDGTP